MGNLQGEKLLQRCLKLKEVRINFMDLQVVFIYEVDASLLVLLVDVEATESVSSACHAAARHMRRKQFDIVPGAK